MLRYVLTLLLIPMPGFADGYLNPEFTGRSYKAVLVTVPVEDLSFRERTEKTTLSYMKKYVASVGVRSLDLFPPIGDVSNEDYKKRLNERNLDAVLAIESTESKGSFPPNYKRTSKTFSMTYIGTRHNRAISASATLYDVATGKTVWVLPIAFTDDGDDIIKELTARVVSQLRKEKLLLVKPKEPSWFSKLNNEKESSERKEE